MIGMRQAPGCLALLFPALLLLAAAQGFSDRSAGSDGAKTGAGCTVSGCGDVFLARAGASAAWEGAPCAPARPHFAPLRNGVWRDRIMAPDVRRVPTQYEERAPTGGCRKT